MTEAEALARRIEAAAKPFTVNESAEIAVSLGQEPGTMRCTLCREALEGGMDAAFRLVEMEFPEARWTMGGEGGEHVARLELAGDLLGIGQAQSWPALSLLAALVRAREHLASEAAT